MKRCQGLKGSLVIGANRDGHAFLAFRHQNLPRREPCLLEWNLGEINFASVGVFSHFSNGRREPSGSIVSNAGDEVGIPCLENHVNHLLLCDGVADLNGARR